MIKLSNFSKVDVHEIDSLIGKVVNTEEEAYDLYSDYAYVVGFGVRFANSRYREKTNKLRQKDMYVVVKGLGRITSLEKSPITKS